MNTELVTAIVTTHNRLHLLKRAIKSILAQTYTEIEIVVVDDASTDGTETYCRSLPLNYIYIPKKESRGGNHARNVGIRAAKGKYVAFLDDDDYWLPEKIEKQVALIESKDCELVHCGRILEIITKNGVRFRENLPDPLHWGDMHKKILLTICTTTTTNILAKRNALLEVGLFDENLRFWQEYELTIRLAQRKPFYFVNEALSVYRVDSHDKNRLTNKYYAWKEAVRYIQDKHKALYKKLSTWEKAEVKILILGDAVTRCGNSGLKNRASLLLLQWLILSFPIRIIFKINRIIARYKLKKEMILNTVD